VCLCVSQCVYVCVCVSVCVCLCVCVCVCENVADGELIVWLNTHNITRQVREHTHIQRDTHTHKVNSAEREVQGPGDKTGRGRLTELVLGPMAPALSRAKATMTLLLLPAQWTTIWLWESFRLTWGV